jgi:hypothetical protein
MNDPAFYSAGYKALRWQYNLMACGDVWGETLSFHFAVAATLFHYNPDLIPASWEYRHSPMCDWPGECGDTEGDYLGEMLSDGWDNAEWNGDDLRLFGDVLSRYASVLRLAGKDY